MGGSVLVSEDRHGIDYWESNSTISADVKNRLSEDKEFRVQCLKHGIELSVRGLSLAAYALSEMERAGDDIPDCINKNTIALLRRISSGNALPEIVMAFKSKPSLANRICKYRLNEQRMIADETPITVVVLGDTGKYTTRMFSPYLLGPELSAQVFGPIGIRSEREQIAYIEEMKSRLRRKASHEALLIAPTIEIDMKNKGINVRGLFISRKDLLRYIQDLEG